MRGQRGITLIALIITIIILLILAGITISFMLGDNGLLNRSKNAGENYSEQAARERLELALADLTTAKITDTAYNENQYIDDNLAKQDMIVNGDIVIVDGWQFEIDRSVPKIASSIGKGKENEQIQIEASSTTSSDYVKATIQFRITYTGEISSIRIRGEEITIPTALENVYTIEKEVTANGKYTIVVQDKEGNYKTGNIEITEITQDMEIWNKRDLETFRDNVNSGRSYEGRTVKVMADIDLEGSEANQWVPIGMTGIEFEGTFNGQYHSIMNIYINTNIATCGFFCTIGEKAKIEKIQIENSQVQSEYNNNNNLIINLYLGILVGENKGIVEECSTTGSVIGRKSGTTNGFTGGIVGLNTKTITKCSNNAEVTTISPNCYVLTGGICGINKKGNISNCYNTGIITSQGNDSIAVGGIIAFNKKEALIENCYNIGEVLNIGGSYIQIGGVIARNSDNDSTSHLATINNCYYLNTKTAYRDNYWNGGNIWNYVSTTNGSMTEDEMKKIKFINNLGNEYVQDENTINNGYPILKWQK